MERVRVGWTSQLSVTVGPFAVTLSTNERSPRNRIFPPFWIGGGGGERVGGVLVPFCRDRLLRGSSGWWGWPRDLGEGTRDLGQNALPRGPWGGRHWHRSQKSGGGNDGGGWTLEVARGRITDRQHLIRCDPPPLPSRSDSESPHMPKLRGGSRGTISDGRQRSGRHRSGMGASLADGPFGGSRERQGAGPSAKTWTWAGPRAGAPLPHSYTHGGGLG